MSSVYAVYLIVDCESGIREENLASRRVAEKCGATFIGLADAPEVDTIQRLLVENKELSHPEKARAAMERGRNAVRIYKVK